MAKALDSLTVALALDCGCELGEGIVWCDRTGTAYWTDVHRCTLWQWQVADQDVRRWSLPDRLGSLALCESGRLLLALAKGLYLAELPVSESAPILRLLTAVDADKSQLRTNDGRADRAGKFVFGTLNEHPARAPLGSFYQFSMRYGLRRLDLGGVAIPNSICFSVDGRTLYYCDSLSAQIMACTYDSESADVSDVRVFAEIGEGGPDGSVIDADGYLWNAQWGGFRLVRYDPNGMVDRQIELPVPQPSCLAFGGENFQEIFITSAREGLSAEELERWPGSGGVFRAQADGLRGLPESRFDDAA